jgi:ribosomal-protein-alanine N-acetyltransferase
MSALATPHVRTERLLLRPGTPADRTALIHFYARSWAKHLKPWSPVPACRDNDYAAMADESILRARTGLEAGTCCRMWAFDAAGAAVGAVSLNNIVRGSFSNADAGWWISADHLRQGFCTEMVRAALRLALTPGLGVELHRVQCGIIPRNVASLGVAAKVGFRREGLALHYLRIADNWEDHIIFARTVEDGPLQ